LVGAVALLVIVTGAMGVLVLTRSKKHSTSDADVARLIEAIRSSDGAGSIDAGSVATSPLENTNAARQIAVEVPAANPSPAASPPVDLPVWQRTPGIWTTPYPEGGKVNPPLPPVKLLPGMVAAPSAPPDAATSANREQLDVEDDHTLR